MTRVTNSFEGLSLLDDVIGESDSVGATQTPQNREFDSGDKPRAAGAVYRKPDTVYSVVVD